METVARLQFAARITYYLGWFAATLGALSHFFLRLGLRLDAIGLTKRNLFEASVLFFMICMASELRTRIPASSHDISSAPKKLAA